MRHLKSFAISLAFIAAFISFNFHSISHALVKVTIPSIEQEATSIWRTINDIAFFQKQGYRVNLPDHPLIDSLIDKSTNGQFGNNHFAAIYQLLEDNVYKKEHYQIAHEKVTKDVKLINQLIHRLLTSKRNWDWSFKTFRQYEVVFTLYGTGGSYDPDQGTITLFTTADGRFMNYDSPANTIMHEIVHMGIEHSLIQKYKLSHGLKERIVDQMTFLLFKRFLPEYKVQPMGDPKIDQYLQNTEDIKTLEASIQDYVSQAGQ